MKRKALLVGINDYLPIGPGGPDLRGCVNDVRDMALTLTMLGIIPPLPSVLHILTNRRATKAKIMEHLKWLVTGAKKGDVLVFYYSGHGSQVIDLDGDEPDGRDETLCPHDYATGGMIKDDELQAVFSTLPAGVNLDVILDSCHSGNATRDLPGMIPEVTPAQTTDRFVEPPLDSGFFITTNPQLPRRGILKPRKGEKELKIANINHVLWAACRDNQTSQESNIGGLYRGIYTYCFCKTLRTLGTGIKRRQLDAAVCAQIASMHYTQIPQLEGTRASILENVFT